MKMTGTNSAATLSCWVTFTTLVLAGCQPIEPVSTNFDHEYRSSHGNERTAVVFIHGILGDSEKTFKSEHAQLSWPQMLADDSSIGRPVRSISLGYRSGPVSQASNIHEIATRLQTRLRDKRIFDQFDNIVLVVHSMGGLIAKHMLLQLQRDDPAAFAKVKGIFFLATPAGGSDLADMAIWVTRNPQFNDMRSEDFNTLLQSEEDEWQAMLRHRTEISPYPKSFCVYEKLPIGPVAVVPRSRAQLGCDERPIAFDRNHINLVKPQNTQDEVYQYVAARIQKIAQDEYVPLRVSVALLSTAGQRLPTSVPLRSGDQYLIEVSSTRPVWFSVYARDNRGKVERYFPSAATGDQDVQGLAIRIPTDPGKAFTLDDNKGAEEIIVFATTVAKERLQKIAEEFGASGLRASEVLSQEFVKRGSTVQPVPQVKPRGDLQSLEAAGTEADVIARLWFWHE